MDNQKELIKEAILELHTEGRFHIGCPWNGVAIEHVEKLKVMEPLPDGAVKMIMWSWSIIQSFGKRVGNAYSFYVDGAGQEIITYPAEIGVVHEDRLDRYAE